MQTEPWNSFKRNTFAKIVLKGLCFLFDLALCVVVFTYHQPISHIMNYSSSVATNRAVLSMLSYKDYNPVGRRVQSKNVSGHDYITCKIRLRILPFVFETS